MSRAYHHRLENLALFHAAARNGFLHGDHDGVSDIGIPAARAAQHLDAHDSACAGIVGHVELGRRLNHGLCLSFGFAGATDNFPVLQLRDRLALANAHDVAGFVGLVFVMGVIFFRPPYGLAHDRVNEAPLHLDHHRLGVRVAHHHTLQYAFGHLALSYFFPPARLAGFFWAAGAAAFLPRGLADLSAGAAGTAAEGAARWLSTV